MSAAAEPSDAESDAALPVISIVSGNPTPAELAAVTAVITTMLDEVEDGVLIDRRPRVTGWQRSQRAVRNPLSPGYGAWRSFSGEKP